MTHTQSDRSPAGPPSAREPGAALRLRLMWGGLGTLAVFALAALPDGSSQTLAAWQRVAHVFLFALVGLAYLNLATAGFRRITPPRVALSMALLLLLAIGAELLPATLEGRPASWRDVLADASGLYWLIAWAMAWLIYHRRSTAPREESASPPAPDAAAQGSAPAHPAQRRGTDEPPSPRRAAG